MAQAKVERCNRVYLGNGLGCDNDCTFKGIGVVSIFLHKGHRAGTFFDGFGAPARCDGSNIVDLKDINASSTSATGDT